MELNYGKKKLKKLMKEIDKLYISTLKAAQPVMLNNKHCFEMYGFDILVDQNLRPWLIEVNACPSLVSTTKIDYILKKNLMNDLINVLIPANWKDDKSLYITCTSKEKKMGNFVLLYNEAKDPLQAKMQRPKTSFKKVLSRKYYAY